MKDLVGKNVIVTAGSAGIGLACAERFIDEGANIVCICSRKAKNVDDAIEKLKSKNTSCRIYGKVCNAGEIKDLEEFFQFCLEKCNKRIDIIVSNVGIAPQSGDALTMDVKAWDKLMNTNLRSHWLLIKFCAPFMPKGSSIILMSSVGGHSPMHPLGIYGVSKTALIGLGRALSGELGNFGIRINTVCPGVIKTKMSQAFWDGDMSETVAQTVALKRHGDSEEVAGLVAYLASSDASFITGKLYISNIEKIFTMTYK